MEVQKNQQNNKVPHKGEPTIQSKMHHSVIKPTNEKGYLLVFVQTIQLLVDDVFKNEHNIWLEVSLSNSSKQKYIERKKNEKIVKIEQNFVFVARAGNKIRFELKKIEKRENHHEMENYEEEVAVCQFPIQKLFNIPRVRHCIEIELASMKKQQSMVIAQKACIMTIQMLHLNEKIGKLQLTLISAELNRDIEIVGKMNTYAIIKFGKLTYKTQTSKGLGKQPTWNQKFVIPIDQISENDQLQMLIQLYDEKSFSDSLIGKSTVNLLEEKNPILVPQHKSKTQKIIIKYGDDEGVGNIKIEYKFFINQT